MGHRNELAMRILKILLSILLFAGVVGYIGVGKVMPALLSIDLFYLPFIFVLFALSIFFAPIPSMFLYLPIMSKKVSHSDFYHLRLFTYMFGTFTFGKLGEYSLLYIIKKNYHITVIPFFFILSLDKAITLLHILIFSLVAFLTIFSYFHLSYYIFILLLILVGCFFFSRFVIHKIRWVSVNLFKIKRLHDFLSATADFSKHYIKSYYPYTFLTFLSTFLFYLLVAYITKQAYTAFSINVPLFSIFLVNSVLGLTSLIPLNLFGFGIKEVTSVYLFTLLGVPAAVTTSIIIIFILMQYTIYLLYFASREFSFGKIRI